MEVCHDLRRLITNPGQKPDNSICLEDSNSDNDFPDPLVKLQMRKLEILEETYANSHNFLASTLQTMVQKRNIPHLEGLAAALIHSSPAKSSNLF